MTAFCVIINNHLNSFYKWHCAINMDAVTNICIKVVPPSSDSTLIHISGFSVIPHFPLHAIHKKGFSTPLRSQAHYGGYGFATLTTSPYLRTFVRVSMVQKNRYLRGFPPRTYVCGGRRYLLYFYCHPLPVLISIY